ncbi:hypothetical protein [Acinetobacter pittii]|uniref:Uncharacterized protein n=1 Tax=Acinetobacter pittii ANC 4050 TaxID=1217691 RepID=R8YJX3_ACIPI|nr:hypothetical protein [Acinetobacter pittii]EOQ69723.1 hypothetical protein F931_00924 [Acinetobacter pittii ANC 4050]
MPDKNKLVDLNEGYQPNIVPRPSEGNVNLGYQPAKSTGTNPTNLPPKTSSPPKKP